MKDNNQDSIPWPIRVELENLLGKEDASVYLNKHPHWTQVFWKIKWEKLKMWWR